jgi:hypothetical protein
MKSTSKSQRIQQISTARTSTASTKRNVGAEKLIGRVYCDGKDVMKFACWRGEIGNYSQESVHSNKICMATAIQTDAAVSTLVQPKTIR